MSTDPVANNVLVETLGSSLRYGGSALQDVPGLLKRVLAEGVWRSFVTRRGQIVEHARFADFVTTEPLEGIGASVELVRRIVAEDKEALDLLDQALANPHGGDHSKSDNSNLAKQPNGTTTEQALRRLRKDAPTLHADVLAGRLSAHAAMVQAGYRPRTITVPITRPQSVAAALRKHMTPTDLAELARLLAEGG